MHDLDDDTRKEVLGEALMDELKAIREQVTDVPAINTKLQDMGDRLENVETDVKVIKAAVTDQSHQLQNHDQRLTDLGQAA